ncbi:MAG: Two-component sensor histidine kinase [Actinomycetia bacterium]|nr:Two-component sensor histidine kinase [Actinomycetes bacterium]
MTPESVAPGRRRRQGLRLRVTLVFALGGLLVTTVLATATYGLTSRYLVRQRQHTAEQQAYVDARVVRDALSLPGTSDATASLGALELPSGSLAVLSFHGRWYGSGVATGRELLPAQLIDDVVRGQPARQRIEVRGTRYIAMGVPIPAVKAAYFELVPFVELDRTLVVIRNSLLGAAAVTTLGAIIVGLWATRRVLRPLSDASTAAARIAAGDLSTRLDGSSDPDLAPLALAFNDMVDALSQRIDRDARFVSDVSHELRSPLTTLATAVQVLQARREELPERSRLALDLVVDEIARFQHVVDELLELSRADAGVEQLADEPVRLGELVLQAASRLNGGPMVVEIDPLVASKPILADKRRLERVLANLFDNARTHGEGLAAIRVTHRGDTARIEVDDNGPGVPVEQRTAVFERFYRGAASGRRGNDSGAGLGLALVTEHVAAHGGRVWVDDRDDGPGARFVVEIPWRPA